MRIVFARLLGATLGLSLLSGCGAVPAGSGYAPPASHPPRTPAQPVEDLSARAALVSHVREIWPSVQAGLTDATRWGDEPLASSVASRSVLGTPVAEWRWAGGIPQDASPWLGLAPLYGDRKNYLIPVLVDGRPAALLGADDQGGRWSVYPESTLSGSDLAAALDQIGQALGTRDFEYYFVDAGTWVLARSGSRVVGVMVSPVFDHRKGDPPEGVLEGAKLRWWLDHPTGT